MVDQGRSELLKKFAIVRFEEEKHIGLIPELTRLLHAAYRPLAERGMRYLATHQPPEITLRRWHREIFDGLH